MNSASLCSLTGRHKNPIPTRFLAPIDYLKIPALYSKCEINDKLVNYNKLQVSPPAEISIYGNELYGVRAPYIETGDLRRCFLCNAVYAGKWEGRLLCITKGYVFNQEPIWIEFQVYITALQRQNTKSKQIFPEKEYRVLSPNFHIHASVSDSYIPTIGLPILQTDPGLYKSLTDTWMCKFPEKEYISGIFVAEWTSVNVYI